VYKLVKETSTFEEAIVKKLAVSLVVVLSLLAVSAMAGEWTGHIVDSKCGVAHAKKVNVNCVKKCIEGGAAAVFVSEEKVYKIDQSKAKVDPSFYGHPVKVTGTIEGDTLKLDTIAMNH
jgi:hypothetical protein